MDDLISRQAAIKLAIDLDCESRGIIKESKCREIENRYNMIPAAQPTQLEIDMAYMRGKADGIRQCTEKLRKLRESINV